MSHWLPFLLLSVYTGSLADRYDPRPHHPGGRGAVRDSLRAFSGVTIGVGGALVGVHWSLAASAALLFFALLALRWSTR